MATTCDEMTHQLEPRAQAARKDFGEVPGVPRAAVTANAAEGPQPRRGKDGRSVEGYHGNRNGLRHGLRASKLPPGCAWLHRELRGFRRAVEDAVVSAHGKVSIMHAAAINTACRAEAHAQLAARWLRREIDKLDHNQRLAYSAAIVKASEARDRALDRLGIDELSLNPWSTLDALPLPAGDADVASEEQPANGSPNAPGAQPGPLAATPDAGPVATNQCEGAD